jgi:hypothetical protein
MDNSTFGEHFRASRSWVNLPTTCKASAGMTGGNRKRMWGGGSRSLGRRQPEDHYEAQIRELEQREKSLNAVLISVREPLHRPSSHARWDVDDPVSFLPVGWRDLR